MSEKMIFCLGNGGSESKGKGYQKNLMVFNKSVSKEEYDKLIASLNENEIKIQLTKWVDENELKDSEKSDTTRQLGGKLKVFTYEEAWTNFWWESTQKQKDCILNIKQFDADIFKGITGIDIKVDLEVFEAIKKLEEKGYQVTRKTI